MDSVPDSMPLDPKPWPGPPPAPGVGERCGPPPRAWRGWLAWAIIIGACGLTAATTRVTLPEDDDDPVGLTVLQLQAKHLVGATQILTQFLPEYRQTVYGQAGGLLNVGTVGQRQRFIVLASELAGPAEARRQLDRLEALIAHPPVGGPVELNRQQAAVQRILHELYPAGLADLDDTDDAAGALGVLSPADRKALLDALGWFGELALAGPGSGDTAARDAVLRQAVIVSAVLVSATGLGILGGCLGFAGLMVLLVFTFMGHVKSGFGPGRRYHIVYAETFALWLVLFIGLQELISLAQRPDLQLVLVVGAFLVSLSALAYPVLRGVPWPVVRRDIGLTLGRRPWLEPLVGLGGYLMTLPLLVVGVVLTLGLMAAQGAMAGEQPTFAPAGGPAHPVILYMAGPDLWRKLQVLLLAAVVAPIVEETMFRGVLYRHLRDATGSLGLVTSVVLSTGANALLFAGIHPQGFVAIPVLMSLACGMTLVREWRGTIVPSMVIHGTSNGLVMLLLLIVFGV